MKIAELSSPEILCTNTTSLSSGSDQLQLLLSRIESSVLQTENLSPHAPFFPKSLVSDLRLTFSPLSQLSPFANSVKLHLWKLSYRLWNACVDLSNAAVEAAENNAKLRHFACDLLSLVVDVSGIPSPEIKSASLYYKTGSIWHDLRHYDLALNCFEKATDLTSKLDVGSISDDGERTLLLEINLARSRSAWEVSDRNLAVTVLNRSKHLLFGSSEHYKALANRYMAFGKTLLSNDDGLSVKEALKLMNEGLELCERGLSAARTRNETLDLKGLRSTVLRFMAAAHLQGGELESVLKCIRILREAGNGGDNHPSLSVLAMKAWLGLGRYGEAEKELRGMAVNKGIPEGIWVSAVEAYFDAAGAVGAETAKGVFLGLLGRCNVSAGSTVRLVNRVLGEGGGGGGAIEGSRVRARVVAELVSDDRVIALFTGEKAEKERSAMHALLWNCAADHFRTKDYEMSAEMFEKSMLYVPHDIESRILRAKGFRVLCLCHLGLSQLDRAQEYINEAEKLEPNIACAFLKFKIYLQKNDQNGAITQMKTMASCLNFMPDFLSLSAHEAVACHALPVAVASLSNLLTFYSSTKSMPTPEVVVVRTLIAILIQEPGNEQEVLKYMKQVHNRAAAELGAESFFGRGEVGKREQNWFAVNAWNFGTRAGREKNFDLSAEFLRLASEFYGVLVNSQVEENNVMVCKSLILCVSAMINSEQLKKVALLNTEVKEAVEMLDRAGKILKSITSETRHGVAQNTTIESDFYFIYTLNAYNMHGRLNDRGSQQLLLVKSFATSKACNCKYLLQIGLTASQGPCINHEVASFALNECLSGLLSSPSPDYQKVALILRKLVAIASIQKVDTDDDDVVYEKYKQAYGIMVGLREGEYPAEEGKWLAMTAWNRAALPVRLGQIDTAQKWMNTGLQLAKKVPGTETYRACMEDFIAGFLKKFPEHVVV